MLRALVVLLLLVNFAFWSWTQGWLDGVVGVRAQGDREPERLQRQVRAESIRVLTPQAALAASAVEARSTCIEAGPFTPEALPAAQAAASAAAPALAFDSVRSERPGVWLVYMGRYPSAEALQRKREELGRTRLQFEEVTMPAELAPGLSLGRYEERGAADAALARFTQRGVRTAKVVEQVKPNVSYRLRLVQADADTAARLLALRSEALGSGFSGCPS